MKHYYVLAVAALAIGIIGTIIDNELLRQIGWFSCFAFLHLADIRRSVKVFDDACGRIADRYRARMTRFNYVLFPMWVICFTIGEFWSLCAIIAALFGSFMIADRAAVNDLIAHHIFAMLTVRPRHDFTLDELTPTRKGHPVSPTRMLRIIGRMNVRGIVTMDRGSYHLADAGRWNHAA